MHKPTSGIWMVFRKRKPGKPLKESEACAPKHWQRILQTPSLQVARTLP